MTFFEDIYNLLSENGLKCTFSDSVFSVPFLWCRTLEGQDAAVLPLAVHATAPSEAETIAKETDAAIRLIKEQFGEYPLIVTEDRWKSHHDMMKARLLAHLGIFDQIYARNCEVRKIDKKTAAEFLSANHSYGDAKCRYRYGLYLKRHTGHNAVVFADKPEAGILRGRHNAGIAPGTLVAVATFSNARKWIKGDKTIRSYEWTRYASLPGVRLSGGMGKLMNAFIEEVQPDDVMTYADLEWSEGKVYERLGFVLEGVKAPVGFYIDNENWKRIAIAEGTMAGVDMPPPARGCTTVGRTGVNGGHVPSALYYFQNFGSNKYRLKLTDYQ